MPRKKLDTSEGCSGPWSEKASGVPLFPRMTVGMMGSAGGDMPAEVCQRVRELGRAIARRGYPLITGACPGLPHEAVKGAKEEGGIVVGVSPALNLNEHVVKYRSPTRGYDTLIFTGSGLMGREIENIRSCDVVIFAGGRSGTLGEFAIAYDEGKVIGVLEDTGGITAHFGEIIQIVRKKTGARVFHAADPEGLLDLLEEAYRKYILPPHNRLVSGHNPDGAVETG